LPAHGIPVEAETQAGRVPDSAGMTWTGTERRLIYRLVSNVGGRDTPQAVHST